MFGVLDKLDMDGNAIEHGRSNKIAVDNARKDMMGCPLTLLFRSILGQ